MAHQCLFEIDNKSEKEALTKQINTNLYGNTELPLNNAFIALDPQLAVTSAGVMSVAMGSHNQKNIAARTGI